MDKTRELLIKLLQDSEHVMIQEFTIHYAGGNQSRELTLHLIVPEAIYTEHTKPRAQIEPPTIEHEP